MLYEITEEDIQAIKNVSAHIEELYDMRSVIDANDVNMLQSINKLNKIVNAWNHQETLELEWD